MTPFITYTLLGFMGLYLVILLHELITRQTGETVVEGEAWCYTMRPEA